MDPVPPESVAPKPELFPTSPEAITKALEITRNDPEGVFQSDVMGLSIEDPAAFELMDALTRIYPQHQTAVVEGFLMTRRIIKENASLKGLDAPTLTIEGRSSFIASEIEEAKPFGQKVNEATLLHLKQIETEDVEMGRALQLVSQYRADKAQFLYGAVSNYRALKRMEEADKLAKSLNGNSVS